MSKRGNTLTLRKAWSILACVVNRNLLLMGAALVLALTFFVRYIQPAMADNPDCGLVLDCTMDGFYGTSGAGSGPWKPFLISGSRGIGLAPVEGWPKGPSVQLHGQNSPFDAGIFQTVAVTPGLGYHFDLAWAVETIDGKGWHSGFQINRRLGIDPYGGTDPNSSNIQWSSDYFGSGKFDLALDAYAQSASMTVYVRVNNPYTDHVVDVYLDTASLKVNSGMAPISVNAPTATFAPETIAPSATSRPTKQLTAIALAPTEQEIPTETTEATIASEATEPIAPSETLVSPATSTKLPTRVRRTTPTPIPEDGSDSRTQALVFVGLTALVGVGLAGLLFALAFIYWLRSRKR